MGCGVSTPETEEGGEGGGDSTTTTTTRGGSIGKNSETAGSLISDQEMSRHSKKSKTGSENTSKEEEDEEEKGDELKISPASPSFRIYCVFPRDPNDGNVVDDPERNKFISDENKKERGQEAVGTKIKRRFNNVKKLLIPPTPPSSAPS